MKRVGYGVGILLGATSALGGTTTQPDLQSDFKTQYLLAEGRLESSYANLRLVGIRRQTDNPGTVPLARKVEFLNKAELQREIDVVTAGIPRMPTGTITISSGAAGRFALLARKPDSPGFSESQAADPAMWHWPLKCAFSTPGVNVGSLFRHPALQVLSVEPGILETQDIFEVAAVLPADGKAPRQKYQFTFAAGTLALLGWDADAGTGRLSRGMVRYLPNSNPPAVKNCECWQEPIDQPGVKWMDEQFDFSVCSFDAPAVAKFTTGVAIFDAGNEATFRK